MNKKYGFLLLLMFGLFFVSGLSMMSGNVMAYNSVEGHTNKPNKKHKKK
jgi:hypothetical protein